MLREKLGARVLGPVIPPVPRVRGYFGQDILLKLEKSGPVITGAKDWIKHCTEILLGKPGFSQVVLSVDVDPV